LALKLLDDDLKVSSGGKRKKKQKGPSLLQDDRFKELFTNPDFEVDTNAEEYRYTTIASICLSDILSICSFSGC
jgi:hypothetical protein